MINRDHEYVARIRVARSSDLSGQSWREKKRARGSRDHNRGDWNVSSKSSNSFRKYAGISRLAFMAWDLFLYSGGEKIHVSMNTASCTYSIAQLSIRYANPLRERNRIRKRITCQIPVTLCRIFLLGMAHCSGFLREHLANEE